MSFGEQSNQASSFALLDRIFVCFFRVRFRSSTPSHHLLGLPTFNPNPSVNSILTPEPSKQSKMADSSTSCQPAALRTAKKPVGEISRPEISWIPSYKVFKDRVERLQAQYPNRRTTVPPGWPAYIDAPRAWAGSDFKSEDDYVMHLSPDDICEIEVALEYFKSLFIIAPMITHLHILQQPDLSVACISNSENNH